MATFQLLGTGYHSLGQYWWYFVGRDGDLAFWVNRDAEGEAENPTAFTVKRFVPGQDGHKWADVHGPEAEEIVAFCQSAPLRYDLLPDKVKARDLYWEFKAGKAADV